MNEIAPPHPVADPTSHPTNVSEYLVSDHRRLDALAADTERLVREGAFPAAAIRFAQFVDGLNRHIDIEEQILFPAIERAARTSVGCTIVMRAEHAEIRRCMEQVRARLGQDEADGFEEAMYAL